LLSADYSQIELRIIAALSKDENMIAAFNSGLDIHTATAARVYNVDVSVFYGRKQELTLLSGWILRDNCRLVLLLAMGGMGKTSLSVKLAEQLQDRVDFVIWRTLRNAPPPEEMLQNLLQVLSNSPDVEPIKDLGGLISRLIHYMREYRCLIVLDNAETILNSDDSFGQYREGYEGYGQLLRRVGEEKHRSCLVV
jgi:hypothetical protein